MGRADAIDKARAAIAAHDGAANSGDLEAVMRNVAEDVVVLAPGMPLVEGRDAFRTFYQGMLQVTWNAAHHISGADVVGDVVTLRGVARGTMTPSGGEPVPVANNFLISLKPESAGVYKIWRAAFGPVGETS